jgi:hypothetical protein
MKKPTAEVDCLPAQPSKLLKLILKLQRENLPSGGGLPALEALQLARRAAYSQQMRVAELIQQINQ